jgi:glycosyltransferase involved in cell wall biosynthesis
MMIVLSEHWKRWAMAEWGLPEERVRIVFNPIEEWFERKALALEPSPNTDVFFLGSIGRRKGVHDIVSLAEVLRNEGPRTSISLIGPQEWTGDLEAVMRKIKAARLTDLHVLPPVSGEAKLNAFRRHGIFLFPSYRENLPLVVLEAAAAARAIITTRVGGIPEFFTHEESVLFVEPGNVKEMQDALRRLQQDPALRRRLALGAREVFQRKLVRTAIMDSLAAVYRSLLESATPAEHGEA